MDCPGCKLIVAVCDTLVPVPNPVLEGAKLAKNIAYVIDVAIIAGALTMTFVVFIVGVPEQNKSMAFTALGSLWTLTGTVVNFHRGSSAGSKAKTEEMMKGAK